MALIGYVGAFLMGITLGAMGSGGSILTVPLLVYGLGVAPIVATGYSLLIVGITALIGAVIQYRQVAIRSATLFAIPSIITTYATRAYLVPNIPDYVWGVHRDTGIMVIFSGLMLVSAVMMYRTESEYSSTSISHPVALILVEGVGVGFITGLLGAGGGFLIIPALVLLMRIPMAMAVGSSLFIVALKSIIGFMGDWQSGIVIEMPMLGYFIACTVAGMVVSTLYVPTKLRVNRQRVFAIFTASLAVLMMMKELL